MLQIPQFKNNLEAALFWNQLGFKVLPIVTGRKLPAVKYDPWLNTLSPAQLKQHWKNHPDHDVGAVLPRNVVVLDTDTPEAETALQLLLTKFGVEPFLKVKTARGYHYYFGLQAGVYAKADSHDGKLFPTGIDVRAYMNSIVLPPSGPKTIEYLKTDNLDNVEHADQAFVDGIFLHNGRRPPRQISVPVQRVVTDTSLLSLSGLLEFVDPDEGYSDWVSALMAIHNATGGSDEGLDLADAWSSGGKNTRAVRNWS